MPDLPNFDDLFRVGRDEVLTRNSRISQEAVEREGTDANILVASSAAIGDEVVGQITDLNAALFLDSATANALVRLVYDRYGMVKKSAAASIGSVQFTTGTPNPSGFTIGTDVIVQTATGVQFITTESTIFPALSSGPITVAVRSVLAGSSQNVKAGEITSIASTITGAPSNLVVNNALATFGADDVEADENLRDRARRFFTTARRGTMAALEVAALGVPGVRKASAFEVVDALGRPARSVQLIIADSFTEQFVEYDTVPPRYQVQSQAISTQVLDALFDVRAAGIYVQVIVGSVIIQPVQLVLSFMAGANVNSAALQARAAVTSYVNSRAPGKPFVLVDALAQLQLVPGLNYTGNEIVSPAGDVVPKPLQVLRTTLGLVSAVAAQTDQPITTGANPDAYAYVT